VKTDPDWTALPAETPFLIKRLLRHCLNRDPRERLGDIRDARIEISEALSAPPVGAPSTLSASTSGPRLTWASVGVWLALIVGLGGAFATSVIQFTPPATATDTVRFSFLPPDDVRASLRPVVSPDGKSVAFIGANRSDQRSLWVHTFASGTSREIPGTAQVLPTIHILVARQSIDRLLC
jgi:hypothetical protein